MYAFFPGPAAPVPTAPVVGLFDPVSALAILIGLVALSAGLVLLAGLAARGRQWLAQRSPAEPTDTPEPSAA